MIFFFFKVQLVKQKLPTPVSSSEKVEEERRLKRFSSMSRVEPSTGASSGAAEHRCFKYFTLSGSASVSRTSEGSRVRL